MNDELEAFRLDVRQRLRKEIDRGREQIRKGRKASVVAESVDRLFAGAPEVEIEEETGGPLVEGSKVRHRTLGWTGELTRVRDDRADVTVVGKRIRCSLGDLVAVAEPDSGKTRRRAKVELTRGDEAADDVPLELNLVGVRVEPGLEQLDRYLDQALISSRDTVRVVHGFGTGRLRKAVRELLDSHPAVARYRAGKNHEGGDGATVVTLDKR